MILNELSVGFLHFTILIIIIVQHSHVDDLHVTELKRVTVVDNKNCGITLEVSNE